MDITLLAFDKYSNALMPVIVQDEGSRVVLMLGFMNREALEKTLSTRKVTFYSRSKKRLWTKGETSNHFLYLVSVIADCDNDTLLIRANPDGPVCHTGSDTCFNEKNEPGFIAQLESIIVDRHLNPSDDSYTASLFKKGINAIAQKVGEEAVELIIEAKDNDATRFKDEAADLLFHYIVLLRAKGYGLADIEHVLRERHLRK